MRPRVENNHPEPRAGVARGGNTAAVAWQGWRLDLPARWSPVKLEGDYHAGYALFADLHRPRLGLRWHSTPVRSAGKGGPDVADWVARMMRSEVGALAAAEAAAWTEPPTSPAENPAENGGEKIGEGAGEGAGGGAGEGGGKGVGEGVDAARGDAPARRWSAALLYLEPDPPGRDVWIGYSPVSGRALQVIYHAHRRERILAGTILPAVRDLPPDGPAPWSIFELSCLLPAGFALEGQALNAGDLALSFLERPAPKSANAGPRRRRRCLTVRQVAVAELALRRMPLARWLVQQRRKEYRPLGEPREVTLQTTGTAAGNGSRPLTGLFGPARRRRRFFWKFHLPPALSAYALHDAARDRLVLVESDDDALAREVAATVGWAGGKGG